ncbi:MAG: pyridoxamine 5'-phosphate oxidase [Bacteroidia bacterium]|nr:pyridoxamine 5'-phosphate oxidase [Bacteroidia bacterium]
MKEKEFTSINHIQTIRKDFNEGILMEEQCERDPMELFERWLCAALEKDSHFANAMTLCTVAEDSMPDCRTVLLRDISYSGFTFYTNYNSAKGKQIEHNSKACLLFFWKELQRQVKIQGEIRFLPEVESDKYFASRPFESQVGAWASQQSKPVKDRQTLDEAFERELKKYSNTKVPRPEHWGGYVLLPKNLEFWQGRTGRLHDRIKYSHGEKGWKMERLMP